MAAKRYFTNKLADSVGAFVEIPKADIKNLCLKYVQYIFGAQTVTPDDADGGLYVGLSGVSYMCYYLSQHPEFAEKKAELLERSECYLQHALTDADAPKNKSSRAAFLLGGCGAYAVAASLNKTLGKEKESRIFLEKYVSLADGCLGLDYLGCGSDELLVGRAGYLSGILFLQKVFESEILPEEKVIKLCSTIVQSGVKYSKKHRSPCPLMYAYYGTEYLGAAHGLSGILQMLLCFPNFLQKHPDAEPLIKDSVDWLLSLQTPSGNFPCAVDEVAKPRPDAHELIHWCHGAPGVVYLMAKAYLRWKEEKYLRSCLACGEVVWNKGLLKKGPGICHGVAGNAYVFLLLYRLTDHHKHLHRALQFANFLTSEEFKQARTPDRPLSLYEGLSGTACFLADLLQPEKAHFPFFDVF
ncbi:LanC-like protein 3 [Araneus ventricosus]|uniref:LanC-like protein 3 homolog n=1 Tax=Araneus ventricosus TaxID=182803 RepID=A0A4Y2KF79_ARAVE|nr:LanC-like protein 3 [Araneus ventricosus]